ncbi:MAG: ferritin [Sphaerochaetaceae bacterium]|nr:ferritin [Sphaerochaetaceae bacterium]
MLQKSIVELLNAQINKELFSAYLYLDMADFYASAGLEGFENWFKVQALEEQDHAMLFRQYVLNNGHDITLSAIADPSREYKDFKEPLAAALEHERYVTDSINTIYSEAIKVKDYRTVQFLDWFVKEQGEEEKNAEDNLRKFELFGTGKGLYMLDRDLKARVHTAPSLVLD